MSKARIFDLAPELARASAKPRGQRDEQPVPYGNMLQLRGQQFGRTLAPYLTTGQVLGLPGAWAAVNKIANGVASMAPLKVLDPDTLQPVKPTPNIAARPNAAMSPFVFWHSATATALMRGNYVGLYADWDPQTFYPRQVISLPTELVTCRYNADGFLEYGFLGETYSLMDLVHVPGLTMPGDPWGIGVVENFRRSLGAQLEQQFMAADTYQRGSVPSGTLEIPVAHPDEKDVEEAQARWIDRHGGQNLPAVLGEGWKYTRVSWSPEDLQFLQSRQFSVAELAFMFGLDPTDLGASLAGGSSSLTYANVEQRQIDRVTDAYGPWMLRFEQAWDDMVPGYQTCKFQPENILRLDAKTRADVDSLDIDAGVTTMDEARSARGKPALTQQEKDDLAARGPKATAAPKAAADDTAIVTAPVTPAPPVDVVARAAARRAARRNGVAL